MTRNPNQFCSDPAAAVTLYETRRLASRCSSRESLILVLFSIALNEEIIAVDFSQN
jgi:hypothetical protein